ncbi:MAG: transposase DNA-binding-containing protein [Firmicutes bacterium]|nr:transposase DNA-binding-containing protein [Bacillota bacterium]
MCWAVTEVGGANFGDARLAQCWVSLVDCFSEHPTTSIAQTCGTRAQTKAA